ncbi:MAG TPA: trimethylamine methyltransferase family protein [Geminicoccaceae bacterium]|nr:trimethylamine methyltransferase family protein [Geminicoccaceae bacterium]
MSSEGRRGGRSARRAERTAFTVHQLPALRRRLPVYEVLSEEALERIHEASCRLLEEIGIEFREAEALATWREAGADVQGQRVRIGRELLMRLVAQTPASFTLHARNPERTVEIGGDSMVFGPNYGSPFVRALDGERRYGTLGDLNDLHKLAWLSPALHNTGSVICEPVDIAIPKRHLHITYSAIRHSDKSFMGPVTHPSRALDAVRMCELVFGAGFVHDNAVMVGLVNGNSPLVWDATMIGALRVYAEAGQALVVAPFTLAGANTPASATATVAELNAEALAAIAFAQLCRPGAKMIYGSFLAAVSMKSGAPMAGTSELALMNCMIGQLARRYRLPWRSSGLLTGAKICDAQAGYESAFNMLPILLAGANYVMHCAGWSEAGLVANFAKFMLDAEQMEMLHKLGQGPRFDDFEEALATMREVGPGGHFLGTGHTQAHFQDAFFMAELFDNNSFEQWQADGGRDAAARGNEAAKRALDAYAAPPIDPAIDEALLAFIAEREAVLPDALE